MGNSASSKKGELEETVKQPTDSAEEDVVEALMRKSGCLDQHYAVQVRALYQETIVIKSEANLSARSMRHNFSKDHSLKNCILIIVYTYPFLYISVYQFGKLS